MDFVDFGTLGTLVTLVAFGGFWGFGGFGGFGRFGRFWERNLADMSFGFREISSGKNELNTSSKIRDKSGNKNSFSCSPLCIPLHKISTSNSKSSKF